jgi:hypothetical protein
MIKASARGADGRHILVLGLTAENIRRLTVGDPIAFDTAALHIPPDQTIGRVMVFYCQDEAEGARVLRTLIGPQTRVDVEPPSPRKPQ